MLGNCESDFRVKQGKKEKERKEMEVSAKARAYESGLLFSPLVVDERLNNTAGCYIN